MSARAVSTNGTGFSDQYIFSIANGSRANGDGDGPLAPAVAGATPSTTYNASFPVNAVVLDPCNWWMPVAVTGAAQGQLTETSDASGFHLTGQINTSGIKGYTELAEFGDLMKLKKPRETLVTLFGGKPLDFAPGQILASSN